MKTIVEVLLELLSRVLMSVPRLFPFPSVLLTLREVTLANVALFNRNFPLPGSPEVAVLNA